MAKKAPYIMWFKDIHKGDIALVGGKGANLGELTNAGIPVPNGFCVTAQAYYFFIEQTGIKNKLASLLKGLNAEDNKKLNKVAREIKQTIVKAKMPPELVREIKEAYQKLGGFPVAVRSSATAEDLPDASFAGQQTTYLNIQNAADVVESVQNCFASLFEARAIYYRVVQKYDHLKVGLSVPVQNLVNSDVAGIMFSVDPVEKNYDNLIIEAGYGLGEAIVLGEVNPDRYIVEKKSKKILNKIISDQTWRIVKNGTKGHKHASVPKSLQDKQKLTDEQIIKLAELGIKIEKHYGKPQDMEFAVEDNRIYIVQARPITTLGEKEEASSNDAPAEDNKKVANNSSLSLDTTKAEILLKGAAASLGSASGPVKIIYKPTEIDKINYGDILVTEMTTPDYVPAMKKAIAIVTDTGGRTCHAAIVSRELGIPCVVGTGTATSALKNGQIITVDGVKGLVYKGKVAMTAAELPQGKSGASGSAIAEEIPVTGTKVYVNLGEPDMAEEIAKQPVDGVGLLRAEFMIAEIGEHPKAMFEAGRGKEYTAKLVEGLRKIAGAFNPRPVVYRCTDFKTNEYRGLKGGDKYEPVEDNPMIGYRGASRYIREPELFALELDAIKKVRVEHDLKNLWIMIPFCRTVDEMRQVIELLKKNGLEQSADFKLWMMCEIPSNVILLEKFLDLGIDGISIGSNDLTQLTLGVDRDNQALAELFDERDESVRLSIEYVIKTCRKRNVTCSICGQAPSVYPEITEMMVKAGTTSVSVTPDVILQTKKLIASVERRLLLSNIIDR